MRPRPGLPEVAPEVVVGMRELQEVAQGRCRSDVDFGAGFPAPRVTQPRYTTVDLAAERSLSVGSGSVFRLLLRAENLLDAE